MYKTTVWDKNNNRKIVCDKVFIFYAWGHGTKMSGRHGSVAQHGTLYTANQQNSVCNLQHCVPTYGKHSSLITSPRFNRSRVMWCDTRRFHWAFVDLNEIQRKTTKHRDGYCLFVHLHGRMKFADPSQLDLNGGKC